MATDQEGRLHTAVSQGVGADRELTLTHAGFLKLRAELHTRWSDTKNGQHDTRERLWLAIQLLGAVERGLTETVRNGKVAAATLRDIEKAGTRRLPFGL